MHRLVALFLLSWALPLTLVAQGEPLRVVAIGAHPDDADVKMGGTAALFARMGHKVKFVSLTNGDAGHQSEGGGSLARRRRAEAQEAARRLGIEAYVVLDNHDGELLPDLATRRQVIREIRSWDADVVVGLRPNDYHPDHRNAGSVVQDAAYLVVVPNVVPDTPPLEKNPIFLYMSDHFQKPNPFSPDVVAVVGEVYDQKISALAAHDSQFFEWLPWVSGELESVPAGEAERLAWLRQWITRWSAITPEARASLEKWYGPEPAAQFQHAEAFEICEYGHQPTDEEIRRLFPMLGR